MALDKLTKVDGAGLSTTSDYRVGIITATKFIGPIEGSITATDANFTGNVTIGGTLTYEDVTNIDSVGIVTARSGIQLDDSITHLGDTNTKIRFPGNDQISFEVGGTQRMIIGSSGNVTINNDLKISDTIQHSNDSNTKIRFPADDTFTVETGGSERVRVTSDGKVGVGVNPTNYPGKFVVSGDALICDRDIHSRVANSVANSDRGFKQDIDGVEKLHLYADNSNNIILEGNGGNERLRIDSNGRVLIGHTTNQTDLHGPQTTTNRNPFVQLHGANAASAGAALISWSNNAGAYYAPSLFLAHSGSNTIGTNGILPANGEFGSIVFSGDDGTDFVKGAMIKARLDGTLGNDDMPGRLEFYTTPDGAQVPVERLRITSAGDINIGSVGRFDASGLVKTAHGSESAPSHTFLNDPDNGMYRATTNTLGFVTGGSERLRIGSSGEIYLGTTNWPIGSIGKSAGRVLVGNGGQFTVWNETNSAGGSATVRLACKEGSDATRFGFVNLQGGTENTSDRSGFLQIEVSNSSGSGIERLRIKSDGELVINHTQSSTPLNNTFLSIYDANSDSSAIDASGISKNYAMISLHNYGTGVTGDATGIGFGAGSAFSYTKGSIAFTRSGGYGTGDLVFLTNNDQDTTMVNDTDEKMRITREGQLIKGHTSNIAQIRTQYQTQTQLYGSSNSTGLKIGTFSNDPYAGNLEFVKSRSATIGTNTLVQNGDTLGSIYWGAADGSQYQPAAVISANIDGSPGTNDIPTRLAFYTTADGANAPTERLRITSTGTAEFQNFGGGQIRLGGGSAHTAKVTVTDNAGTGNGNFIFAGPSGEHLRISSAGQVLINKTSATYTSLKFEVNGSTSHGDSNYICNFSGDSDNISLRNMSTGDYEFTNSQNGNSMSLYDGSGGCKMEYYNNGHYLGMVSDQMASNRCYSSTTTGDSEVRVGSQGYIRRLSSTRRFKNNIREYNGVGVSAIKQIVPKLWEDHEEGFTKLGFIAEEIHDIGLTNAVLYGPYMGGSEIGIGVTYGDSYGNGSTPVTKTGEALDDEVLVVDGLDTMGIIAELVVAVKQLTARIETLESGG